MIADVDGARRGTLVAIGGAEEKFRDPAVLRRFIGICGGAGARIAILPTASRLVETGPRYEKIFGELGVATVSSIDIRDRDGGQLEEWVEALDDIDGLFMTGGNQLSLSTTLGGTPFCERLIERHGEGLHVGGTSAGAAFLSEHMIAAGAAGSTPRSDMVTLAPGLGLTRRVIVDQHFRQRDRLGRLITALSYNPRCIGVGLDEDTAAIIHPDRTVDVCGSGAITVVDPQDVEHSSMDSSRAHDPVCVIGLRLHVLPEGASFDIETRRASPTPSTTGRE